MAQTTEVGAGNMSLVGYQEDKKQGRQKPEEEQNGMCEGLGVEMDSHALGTGRQPVLVSSKEAGGGLDG